jgi:hypothetical protein
MSDSNISVTDNILNNGNFLDVVAYPSPSNQTNDNVQFYTINCLNILNLTNDFVTNLAAVSAFTFFIDGSTTQYIATMITPNINGVSNQSYQNFQYTNIDLTKYSTTPTLPTTSQLRGVVLLPSIVLALSQKNILMGTLNVVSTINSQCEGLLNAISSANNVHVEGYRNMALSDATHIEGSHNIATMLSLASHAEGYQNMIQSIHGHIEGEHNFSDGIGSHAEGGFTLSGLSSTIVTYSSNGDNPFIDFNIAVPSDIQLAYLIIGSLGNTVYPITLEYPASGGIITIASNNFSILPITSNPLNAYLMYSVSSTNSNQSYSHTEGFNTIAAGNYSHAEGGNADTITVALGQSAHAEGANTLAIGDYSHTEGLSTVATGNSAHTEGLHTLGYGLGSHSEGTNSMALSDASHAEGTNSISGIVSLPIIYTVTSTTPPTATITPLDSMQILPSSYNTSSIVFGYGSCPAFSNIFGTNVSAPYIVSDLTWNYVSNSNVSISNPNLPCMMNSCYYPTTATLWYGDSNTTNSSQAHSEGVSTISGINQGVTYGPGEAPLETIQVNIPITSSSHAEGIETMAIGPASHSEGINTLANAFASHVEGYGCVAGSPMAHAEGMVTLSGFNCLLVTMSYSASGGSVTPTDVSHMLPSQLQAQIVYISFVSNRSIPIYVSYGVPTNNVSVVNGDFSSAVMANPSPAAAYLIYASDAMNTATATHAEGVGCIATGSSSHAEGLYCIANGACSHAQGYNTTANGDYCYVGGSNATNNQNNSYLWNDGSTTLDNSVRPANSYVAKATGGFYFISGTGFGAQLVGNSSTWGSLCSRTFKNKVADVDHELTLEKLSTICVDRWVYKSDLTGTVRMSPYAEDFNEQFDLGDNNTLTTLDLDGVALSSIKGLYTKHKALKQKVSLLEDQNKILLARMAKLEKIIGIN